MYHRYPPGKCWCGEKHAHGEAFDLNVYGVRLPPDKYDGEAVDDSEETTSQTQDE